LVVLGFRKA